MPPPIIPPRRIRQLPSAIAPKDSDVFPISQIGEDGIPHTRAMQRAQFQQDIIDAITLARLAIDSANSADRDAMRERLTQLEQGMEANGLLDQQLSAAMVMLQQMIETGDSGTTAYDLWLEAGNTGTLLEYLGSMRGPQGERGEKGDGIIGERGERGEPGVAGVGIQGPSGNPGADGKDSTVPGPVGPQGAPGSNASATPLATQMATALGNAAAGVSAKAAREDHVHPLPAGRMVLVGNVTANETMLLSASAGVRRLSVTLAGITTADNGKLFVTLNGAPSSGCELFNAYATAANTLSVGIMTPNLGLGASYSLPLAIYRVT